MTTEIIIRIILDSIIIIIGLYFIFWKSYLTEKGKNLATKKDIEEITKKIETVKNEISFHSQRKHEYINDKKKAALDFLNSVSIWLDFTLRPLETIYNNPTNEKLLRNLISDLKKQGGNATTCYWNLFVYFDNENFNKIVDEFYNNCLVLHNLTNTMLINIERKAIETNHKEKIFDLIKDKEKRAEINDELKEINIQINEFIKTYNDEKEKIDEKATLSRLKYLMYLNRILKIKTPAHNKGS